MKQSPVCGELGLTTTPFAVLCITKDVKNFILQNLLPCMVPSSNWPALPEIYFVTWGSRLHLRDADLVHTYITVCPDCLGSLFLDVCIS